MPDSSISIAEEVKEGCFGEAAMLIRAVLADGSDLDGFHALERQFEQMHTLAWMPQALACVAADLALELAELRNKVSGDREQPEDVLRERVWAVEHGVRLLREKRDGGDGQERV